MTQRFPLSAMQRPLWASQRRTPSAPSQNMALLTHLDGPIDAARFVASVAKVIESHGVLRTRVVEVDGTPVVELAAEPRATLVLDVERDGAARWAEQRASAVLDLGVAGYDSVLLVHEDATSSWYLALHHTITDATSSALLLEATAAAYFDGPAPDGGSYYDWAASLDAVADRRRDRARAFWAARTPAPKMRGLYQPVVHERPDSERRPVEMSAALAASIQQSLDSEYRMISQDLGWTTLLLTATATLVHRVTGAAEFSIGLPVHNRNDAVSRRLVGPVMELFPVDISVEPDDTYRSLHRRVGRRVLDVLRHAQPGLAPASDSEVVVNVIPRAVMDRFGEIPAVTRWIPTGAADASHLLRVQLTAYGETGRELVLDLNQAASAAEHRERAPLHVLSILERMVSAPDEQLVAESLCTVAESLAWNDWETTPDLAGPEVSIVDRLRRRLGGGASVVLEDGDQIWTGNELWEWSGRIATDLRNRGAGRGSRIGIRMDRSAAAVAAVLGILRAGAAYVPLDPAQPQARIDRLVERAGCRLVLDAGATFTAMTGPGPSDGPHLDDEAYLLFTSGSTGEPKGVPITHLGLARYLHFAEDAYLRDGETPVVPLFSALTFDLTVTSLFLPLLAGGRLVVIRGDGVAGLSEISRRPELTWCKATPSHLTILERMLSADHGLRTFVVGGEAFGVDLARRLATRCPGARLFNEYGPTEAVVGCMIHEWTDTSGDTAGSDVPIGRPAPGVTLRVVDHAGNRVPIGTPGELLIAHAGVTAGYLGGDLDAFVELEGQRFYRSGDLVRMIDDATLTYLGRIDEQVKVGGIRLDPSEVEAALAAHPVIASAAVRLWSPRHEAPSRHCVRCGLPSNVPGSTFDDEGVCTTCHDFERIAPIVADWFKSPHDLDLVRERAHRRQLGKYDCLALLSGGKDSTYALCQLVERGFVPYALTLDNGFLSDQAMANIRRTVTALGVDHEFATSEVMNEIFRDSLERYSNVCNGCFKTIYTVATERAVELGIPVIVTGLSRGQLFETRLIPQQFESERFSAESIDRAVLEARRAYHRVDDTVNRLLDSTVFTDDSVFERVEYVDFYRYVDVSLADMLEYLEQRAPWVRPTDTGRSTNCRINDIGIHTHLLEQGFHNYAVPYAWDVRLGHKTREQAIEELDDRLEQAEVDAMLSAVGYAPSPRQILTAWLELVPGVTVAPSPGELRSFLGRQLPAHAVPRAFVTVDALPLTTNGKLDARALPAPQRVHRSSPGMYVSPRTSVESDIVAVWEAVLQTEPIGVDDDFFALGGDSLAALEMIVRVGDRFGVLLAEELAFLASTPRALAESIAAEHGVDEAPGHRAETGVAAGVAVAAPKRRAVEPVEPVAGTPPALSIGERSVLFDLAAGGPSGRYNVGQMVVLDRAIDPVRFADALREAAGRHVPLTWTFGTPRRLLPPTAAVEFVAATPPIDAALLPAAADDFNRRPFDLEQGPLLRALVQPLDDGRCGVVLSIHHVSGDAESLGVVWSDVRSLLDGRPLPDLSTDYPRFAAQRLTGLDAADADHWRAVARTPARLAIVPPGSPEPDGFLRRTARVAPQALRTMPRASAFVVAATALAATLRRRADGPAIELGIVASVREQEAAGLVGYLLNTLPVTLDVDLRQTFRDLVAHGGVAVGQGLAHRRHPLATIVADRRAAGLPVPELQALLSFHELEEVELVDASGRTEVLFNGHAVADLTVFVEVHADRVDLGLEYRGRVMSRHQAEVLLDELDVLLDRVTTRPDEPLADLIEPRHRARLDGPPPADPLGPDQLLMDRILGHGQASHAAVVCGEITTSWSTLVQASAAIAAGLVTAGVGRGDPVIVSAPRSAELVAAMLAVMRIGAIYVPLDPSYPQERRRVVATTSGARVAIVERADPAPGLTEFDLGLDDLLAADPIAAPVVELDPNDVAYAIFTSGTTGVPQGVPITHRQLAASTTARFEVYPSRPERFVVVSSFGFDSSIAGLFWTLVSGGTIVLPTDNEAHDPEAIRRLLTSPGTTHTLLVPTLYHALLDMGPGGGPWPQTVIVAGEASTARLVARHEALHPDRELWNEYGPTEAAVWATVHRCRAGEDPVPIGTPIPGWWVAVVGTELEPLAPGVHGELVIGGVGVADGYLHDERAPSEKFAVTRDGERVVRTGDRAAITGGVVVFGGRIDHQLNLGGVRCEPEEIERVLTGVEGVTAALVVPHDPRSLDELLEVADEAAVRAALQAAASAPEPRVALLDHLRRAVPGEPWLVAHVEVDSAQPDLVDALRSAARANLAPSLRPRRFVTTTALPRTPHGKLDRVAAADLVVPDISVAAHPTTQSPTPAASLGSAALVDLVAAEMGTVLRTGAVGPIDSFFDLGGHSLLALELVERLTRRTGVRVGIAAIYGTPTPVGIAAALQAGGADPHVDGPAVGDAEFLLAIQPDGHRPPLFAVHVLGRNGAYYRPLAERLGPDQPVLGLGLTTGLGETDAPTDVVTIASRYAAVLEQVHPVGVVQLAAVSLGAVVAVELANQLSERGRTVGCVLLFDAAGPAADRFIPRGRARVAIHLAELRGGIGPYVRGRYEKRRLVFMRWWELTEVRLRTRVHLPVPERLRVRSFIESNIDSALGHELRPYAGSLTVFKAAQDAFLSALAEHEMGWGEHALGGVEVVSVPGGHLSMLQEPYIDDLAPHIAARLADPPLGDESA